MPGKSQGHDAGPQYKNCSALKNPFAHIKKNVEALLKEHVPQHRKKHFLLAVSGGPDSVLLAHVFHALGLHFSMAHVNYGLRGKESDADETFVKKLAARLGVKCFVKKAGKQTPDKKGGSLQMQAREMRYAFFGTVMQQENADVLVLAHQAGDQVETILLNLFRGAGIDGLTGMKVLEEKKFRPLLAVNKKMVLAALNDKKIKFRNDSSNAKSDYRRNFLRNEVIPLIQKKWPGFEKTMLENIQRFGSASGALKQKTKTSFNFGQGFDLDLDQLHNDAVLADVFKKQAVKAGFKFDPLQKLLNNTGQGSKKLEGAAGQLEKTGSTLRFIPAGGHTQQPTLEIKGNRVSVRIPQKDHILSYKEEIRAAAVKGRLVLRKWETGDRMVPLGMKGTRLISRMLTDLKLPLSAKNQVQVLCDAEKIVWLVGFRIDDRVKLKDRKTSTGRLILSVV